MAKNKNKTAPKMVGNFDLPVFKWIATAQIDDFDQFGHRTDTPDGSYVYIDRGPQAKILGIAHRDTVCPATHFSYDGRNNRIWTPTLDDRLGVMILMSVLPRFVDYNQFDILLTEGEEQGRSTAKYFKTEKQYNWMFQFDRGGVDAVHYQYTDPDWLKAIKDLNCKIEGGSFSDIAYAEHLGVCGVNVGCAYYQYHSKNAYCNLTESEDAVRRFANFFEKHKETKYEHDERSYGKHGKKVESHTRWSRGGRDYTDYKYVSDDDADDVNPYDFIPEGHDVETCNCVICPNLRDKYAEFLGIEVETQPRQGRAASAQRFAYNCSWCTKPTNVIVQIGDNRICSECDELLEAAQKETSDAEVR